MYMLYVCCECVRREASMLTGPGEAHRSWEAKSLPKTYLAEKASCSFWYMNFLPLRLGCLLVLWDVVV